MAKFDEKTTKDPFPQRAFYFSIIAFFIGIPSGNLCGVETHKTQSHTLIKGNCAVFIKYALIIANEQSRVLRWQPNRAVRDCSRGRKNLESM